MEIDFQVLIYIVFIVIAILSRFLKSKKKKEAAQEYESEDSSPTPKKRATSFEDLFKEFTNKVEEEVRPILNPEEIGGSQGKETPREYDFNSNMPSNSELDEVYEESSTQNLKIPEQKVVFEHFKRYEEEEDENQFALEIKEMLSENDSAAKAIVLSEIINRKY